jgi:hypothetical protein
MDFTSYWATWQKIRSNVGLIIVAILIFAGGWQTGHVMSPYYQAAPITFQENASENHAGDTPALQTLNDTGQALKPTSKPSIVPTATTNNNSTTAPYVASKNSKLYHDSRCPAAKSISPANLRTFTTPQQAEAAGFTASACTQSYLSQK